MINRKKDISEGVSKKDKREREVGRQRRSESSDRCFKA